VSAQPLTIHRDWTAELSPFAQRLANSVELRCEEGLVNLRAEVGPLAAGAFTFGPFRLLPEERALLEDGKAVRLGGRALDILTALVVRSGTLISKEDLISYAWPRARVEEANLRVHIGALRNALGENRAGVRYIATVAGRGYCFVAPVHREDSSAVAALPPGMSSATLPVPITRMIGRDDAVVSLLSQMRTRRLVTIVGPGGMGKTRTALAVAGRFSASLEHQAQFVDFSRLSDPLLLPSSLASVLGVPSPSEDPFRGVIEYLRDKQMLIVLDSCEHVIDAAAILVEAVLKAGPGIQVLATSREPLRAEGEYVKRLAPLRMPSTSANLTAAQALAFPAIELFAERASMSFEDFELTDADVPATVATCMKLDGLPLAIELAAGRMGPFGIRELAKRLDDRFTLLAQGRRTALPRHKTLTATLDWSYGILAEHEQTILRRLAVFCGEFTMDSAQAVAASKGIGSLDVLDGVTSLMAKSLVSVALTDAITTYRLLETTRAYAREKLLRSNEIRRIRRLHALDCSRTVKEVEATSQSATLAERITFYRRRIDDVRSALEWAYSPDGDAGIGETLTAVHAPMFLRLSLLDEYRGHVEQALQSSATTPTSDPFVMRHLNLALGHLLLHMEKDAAQMHAAFGRALKITDETKVPERDYRALVGVWLGTLFTGDYPAALMLAQRVQRDAGDPAGEAADLVQGRMMALSLHYMGQFGEARRFIERILQHPLRSAPLEHDKVFFIDLEVATYTVAARNSWIEGYPDRASDMARQGVERAISIDNAVGICYALGIGALPVAIWRGDLPEARRLTTMLLEYAGKYGLPFWQSWARLYQREVLLLEEVHPESAILPSDIKDPGLTAIQIDFIATLREDVVPAEALARVESGRVGWSAAEILRVAGEAIRREAAEDAPHVAEAMFHRSLDLARRQCALSWELRTATSLARLWRDQHRVDAARELLSAVRDRFGEGFQTRDCLKADTLLQDLRTLLNAGSTVRVA
jgi:predicted ATPase/DNA-binding winged helix-turn-helix (wHTH) protein